MAIAAFCTCISLCRCTFKDTDSVGAFLVIDVIGSGCFYWTLDSLTFAVDSCAVILCCFFLFQLYLYTLLLARVPLCFDSFSWDGAGLGLLLFVYGSVYQHICLGLLGYCLFRSADYLLAKQSDCYKPEKSPFQPSLPSCLLQLQTLFDERITIYSNVHGFSWPGHRTMQPAK